MSKIRGKDTGPELRLRKALWAAGLRYRLKSALPGHPDMLFPGARVALFVDGCFWHGCPEHGVMPKGNREFWAKKISGNLERDFRATTRLEADGWSVMRVWEHDIDADVDAVVARVAAALRT